MNKLERIKNKLAKHSGLAANFSDFEKAIQQQSQAAEKFIKSVEDRAVAKVVRTAQNKLLEKAGELVTDVKEILEKNHDGLQEVIEYLEKQEQRTTDLVKGNEEIYKNIIKSLKTFAKQSQEVIVKNNPKTITAKEVKSAFGESLEAVTNILVNQNEVPGTVAVSYNNQDKVSRIVENYESYTLTTSISYDSSGKVTSWTTVKR
jgi:predicted phage tail protein